MREVVEKTKSRFIKVICDKCKNEQIIFDKASTIVKCLVCENILAEPTGGMATLKVKVDKIFS